jgi:hypothetical protein
MIPSLNPLPATRLIQERSSGRAPYQIDHVSLDLKGFLFG